MPLLANVSALVISKGVIQQTDSDVFVVPLARANQSASEAGTFLNELIDGLVTAMRSDTVGNYCRSLGCETIPLKGLKGGLLVTTLRKANQYFELKPNLAGMGVNLNAAIERFVGPPSRELPSEQE